MAGKRKRDILDFDPNKSDSDDENFEPDVDRPRTQKKSRAHRANRPAVRKKGRYRGSDIEDDDELGDSELENSFAEDDDEEEPEPAINETTGRRIRKAATKHQSYKESSEDEEDEIIQDSDEDKDDLVKDPPKRSPRQRKLITLKVPPSARKTRAASNTGAPIGTRRVTRARTVDRDDAELVELSNSGRHARPARGSKSKSPEAFSRASRPTRSGKGIKKPASPLVEVDTQEEDKPPEAAEVVQDPVMEHDAPAEEDDLAQADQAGENVVKGQEEPIETVERDDKMDVDEEDEDVGPVTRKTRGARANQSAAATEGVLIDDGSPVKRTRGRLTRKSRVGKSLQEPSSDFEPGNDSGDEHESDSDANQREVDGDDENSSPSARGRRSSRGKGRRSARRSQRRDESGDEDEVDENEVAEELEDLQDTSHSQRRRRSPKILFEEKREETRRRRTQPVNYAIAPLNAFPVEQEEEEDDAAQTPARRRGRANGGGGWDHNLHSTAGALGGIGLTGALLGGPWGTGAAGGADSDSSDDEMNTRSAVAGIVGMTPTSAAPQLGPSLGNADGAGGLLAAAPNVGKIKNPKALADADPLGVDMNVDFSQVGGLQGHIDQLKEMVQLPLLYPELFTKFHVTPPRGVLFHGPPGTGKTLLARALANTMGVGGRKITFYMRKGADALSKWVGEAEKQLRLLFEEARRTQPSIIFFDEIDGLAPVRSSKQEQIHASIVSTLLALMDGMDGRGQVIVIGATNRPDSVDPALRRPGRFDREFYFPLPDVDGRKSIIDIHTKDWGISDEFKWSLARETKGYGGADLRAMCTEAALNAIQRTYPQIYLSKEKLVVNPDKINIHMTDFMLSKNKIVPSSERSATSGASPFPKPVEPLLRDQFKKITNVLDSVLPRKKKVTALDEAMFEPYDDADFGFGREALEQEFLKFRVYRPRLLICGPHGMGQVYISAAMLHYLEGVHVQNFDLPNIYGESLSPEQVLFGLFAEARRQKPSVIFIPNVDVWYNALHPSALAAFMSMLRTIQPTDSIMVVGTAETELNQISPDLKRDLFGLSNTNFVEIAPPRRENRQEYFERILSHIRRFPKDFPDPVNRKKRVLEELPVAPPPPPKQLTLEEIQAENLQYRRILNLMKVHLQPIMDQIKRKYRLFRTPIIPQSKYQYLFDEADPNYVRPDVPDAQPRPYELGKDKEGTPGLIETATNKFFYNLDTVTIETRLANAYYITPEAFLKDAKSFEADAKTMGDKALWLKANELATNVSVDVSEVADKFRARWNFEEEWNRELFRQKEYKRIMKSRKREAVQSTPGQAQRPVNSGGSQGGHPPRLQKLHTTSARFQVIGEDSLTNGEDSPPHTTTNGTSVPSRAVDDDVHMIEADNQVPGGPNLSMQPPSQFPRIEARSFQTSMRATPGGTTQISQVSAVQSLPPGVSPSALVNDASTTKTSDPSSRSYNNSTQVTNGVHGAQSSQNDALQDTQPLPGGSQSTVNPGMSHTTSSDEPWPHSQAQGLLRGFIPQPGSFQGSRAQASPAGGKSSHAPSVANLLNDPSPDEQSPSQRQSGASSSQQVELDEGQAQYFLDQVTDRTSGCTIEQLQQIFREMMVEIWRTRGEHNRMKVLNSVTRVFNEAISDIESVQGMLQPSQSVLGGSI